MVTKLHIDFNKQLKQKDRLLSIVFSRKAVAGYIILIVAIWMIPGLFVENKEKGDHFFIGDDAVKISGGQAQRIGIARGLYKNPDFYRAAASAGGPF